MFQNFIINICQKWSRIKAFIVYYIVVQTSYLRKFSFISYSPRCTWPIKLQLVNQLFFTCIISQKALIGHLVFLVIFWWTCQGCLNLSRMKRILRLFKEYKVKQKLKILLSLFIKLCILPTISSLLNKSRFFFAQWVFLFKEICVKYFAKLFGLIMNSIIRSLNIVAVLTKNKE